ncbi:serine O-acetyltransferase [Winogradskyella wichelsiae]|uniref:serine O-acetyltransferase n=1 Tax=Winogradskyella wichelsiae TaxID=2697007 RepID=UPI0015CCA527|nr:serine acetyltransferase [Winogradskyella wichelsiae]
MIQSKSDYYHYVKQDKKALKIEATSTAQLFKNIVSPNYIWKFQQLLRKVEYFQNCKKGIINKLYLNFLKYKFKAISIKLGFSIPPNVFGPGLSIVHYGTIVINSNTKVGSNCRIHVCVNIGASGGESEAPQLGDNVYIAPGAKIYGNISIPNNTAIGANAVVNKSFSEENTMIAGIPARVISEIDIKKIIKHL